MHQLRGNLRLILAELLYRAERVVNKVGLDLTEHGGDPAVLQLLFQLLGTDGGPMVDLHPGNQIHDLEQEEHQKDDL